MTVDPGGIGALLSRHLPADDVEAGYVRAMHALLASTRGAGPFSRTHFVPGHFTASAFVTRPEPDGSSSLLLVHHAKLGRWLQPGGHFEPSDEDLFMAAVREVVEETGIPAHCLAVGGLLDVDIHRIPELRGEPAHEHHDLRLHLEVPAGTVAVEGDGVRGVRWVTLDPELRDAARWGADDSVLRAARRLVAGAR